jgi:hypothetical protein
LQFVENSSQRITMVNKIEFPPQEQDDFDRDCVAFPAKVDGQKIVCRVSHEALMERCMATTDSVLSTFRTNRATIKAIAAKMIEEGRVAGGELLICSADFGSRR